MGHDPLHGQSPGIRNAQNIFFLKILQFQKPFSLRHNDELRVGRSQEGGWVTTLSRAEPSYKERTEHFFKSLQLKNLFIRQSDELWVGRSLARWVGGYLMDA